MNYKREKSLISLLEDEDQNIASKAILELLKYKKELDNILKKYQESPNPLLRKRIHQIQAILKIRKSRDILSRRLNNSHSGLWNGLIEIHSLWFDCDNRNDIDEYFYELLSDFNSDNDMSAQSIGYFMKSMGFVVSLEENTDSNNFCLGTVLESKIGSEVLLCAIVHKLLTESEKKSYIIKINGKYGIACPDNLLLMPKDWKPILPTKVSFKVCTPGELLKNTILKLFFSAISSDSFRYVFTIGSCIVDNFKTL